MSNNATPTGRSILTSCTSDVQGRLVHKAPNFSHHTPANVGAEILFHQRFSHPTIPEMLAPSYELDGRRGFLRRYVEGQEMFYVEDMYQDDGKLVDVVRQLLDVLAFIHQGNFVYADVNPFNIILTEKAGELQLSLIDFEMARPVGGELISIGHRCFSYDRVSLPERRYDLYSVVSMLAFFRATERINSPIPPFQVIKFCREPWRGFLEPFIFDYYAPSLEDVEAFRVELDRFQQETLM